MLCVEEREAGRGGAGGVRDQLQEQRRGVAVGLVETGSQWPGPGVRVGVRGKSLGNRSRTQG